MKKWMTLLIALQMLSGCLAIASSNYKIYDEKLYLRYSIQCNGSGNCVVYDSKWYPRYRIEKGEIYDMKWRRQYQIEKDQNGRNPSRRNVHERKYTQ
jgi:hypothetical protein